MLNVNKSNKNILIIEGLRWNSIYSLLKTEFLLFDKSFIIIFKTRGAIYEHLLDQITTNSSLSTQERRIRSLLSKRGLPEENAVRPCKTR